MFLTVSMMGRKVSTHIIVLCLVLDKMQKPGKWGLSAGSFVYSEMPSKATYKHELLSLKLVLFQTWIGFDFTIFVY